MTDTGKRDRHLASGDSSGKKFEGRDFRHADLRDADFEGATFKMCTLFGANLEGANFRNADLSSQYSREWLAPTYEELEKEHIEDVVAFYYPVELSKTNLDGADFGGANISRGYIDKANLVGADFTGAKLPKAQLQHADLTNADFRCADLCDADLTGADLSGADLREADCSGAIFKEADLSDARLRGANFEGATLDGANLCNTNLTRANLSRATIDGAALDYAVFDDTDLRDLSLNGADLSGVDFSGFNLSGENLRGTDLSSANLRQTNLSNADLSAATLSEADLREADLRDAELPDADLSDANLWRANVQGINLKGADIHGAVLVGTHLSESSAGKPTTKARKLLTDLYNMVDVSAKEIVPQYRALFRSIRRSPEVRKVALITAFLYTTIEGVTLIANLYSGSDYVPLLSSLKGEFVEQSVPLAFSLTAFVLVGLAVVTAIERVSYQDDEESDYRPLLVGFRDSTYFAISASLFGVVFITFDNILSEPGVPVGVAVFFGLFYLYLFMLTGMVVTAKDIVDIVFRLTS